MKEPRGIDGRRFTDALSRFPSGVTIVTTTDARGRDWGFTASSFCSVSMDPPLVLVCLATTADCFDTFLATGMIGISVISHGQEPAAYAFAKKGVDKFRGWEFERHSQGVPLLAGSAVRLVGRLADRHAAGDHVILVAEVVDCEIQERLPSVYFDRTFRSLESANA